jgi:hypothetical protein
MAIASPTPWPRSAANLSCVKETTSHTPTFAWFPLVEGSHAFEPQVGGHLPVAVTGDPRPQQRLVAEAIVAAPLSSARTVARATEAVRSRQFAAPAWARSQVVVIPAPAAGLAVSAAGAPARPRAAWVSSRAARGTGVRSAARAQVPSGAASWKSRVGVAPVRGGVVQRARRQAPAPAVRQAGAAGRCGTPHQRRSGRPSAGAAGDRVVLHEREIGVRPRLDRRSGPTVAATTPTTPSTAASQAAAPAGDRVR